MATALTLNLRIRRDPDRLIVPRKAMQDQLAQDAATPGTLRRMFEQAMMAVPESLGVHDKQHLETIAFWAPEGGLSAREDAKWLGLRTRISRLDDTREGLFTINASQAELLWSRLKDPNFKVRANAPWSAFQHDYLIATGNVFEDVTAELLDSGDL